MKAKIILLFIICFGFCSNIKAQSQAEMNEEASKKFSKVDANLNQVYKKLMNILDKKDKVLLTEAQRNWIKFRDSHCKFEISESEGGSIQPLIYSQCLIECTEIRIKELNESFKNRNQH
jgi:uncharacterized protein YecT (DUF1311 family)